VGGAMGRVGFIVLLIISLQSAIYAKETTYKVYYPWESDSILVAWAIHTYINPQASFVSVDKTKKKISKKEAINTANSKFRRTARYTAFETAIRYFKIKDSECIKKLTKAIRVLEMTPWKKQEYEDVLAFEEGFVPLFPQKIDDNNLSKVFDYIDTYCKVKK